MSDEFKGTPGPWFGDNGRAIGPKSTEDDQSYGMIIPVGWVEFDHEVEVQVANQQIMAAAPELLDALQDMLSGWKYIREQHGDLYGVGWDRAQNKAIEAITKALGESK